MPILLHLDCSARPESVSRQISAEFAAAWRSAHPDGRVVHRDLAATPARHVDAAHIEVVTRLETAGTADLGEARRAALNPEERASWRYSWELIDELLACDVLLIGLPMYNFSVPSTFKAWFDRVAIPPLIVDSRTGKGPLSGLRTVVATARGGSYGPGSPRHGDDFQEPYLRAAFGMVGLADDLLFLHAEMTKSGYVPQLASYRRTAIDSLRQAVERAREIARG
ncbi:FMN-dependent NADH-azoreductase [Streptomyces poonensis]|uniref:FMN dependent NADH:quinone oxidoreductase n=1 Tax=Streptomyces poonensis TaxID=68255 RepID=A0A918UPQ7_9ACTN|nr:NAD(P)H-dependent oxidoreductase [Streptomyces poonensis]GGZ25617.1 FMN-dependent NADH-azoreductase [Streptomyces poonensis]GLJ89104.1 FMN-dependent NADH-azoreductase [Streptomyces poonensis]